MADFKLTHYSPILLHLRVLMDHYMYVGRTALVKSWVESRELEDALVVRKFASAEEAIFVDTAYRLISSIGTGRISRPNLNESIGERLAGGGVDDANVDYEGYATTYATDNVNKLWVKYP